MEESDAARRAGQPGWSRADGRRKWAPVDSMRYNVCSPSLDTMDTNLTSRHVTCIIPVRLRALLEEGDALLD